MEGSGGMRMRSVRWFLLLASMAACSSHQPLQAPGVPRTGQVGCWDEMGASIDCAGTGQDGDLRKGRAVEHRFTDNADGTVTDNLTGLVWLRNTKCFEKKNWQDALATVQTLADGCCCELTDGSRPGDWRLPNIKELLSLVDYGEFNPAFPAGHPFEGLTSTFYWSSTSIKGNPNRAFSIYLNFGVEATSFKSEEHRVWPVRDGS